MSRSWWLRSQVWEHLPLHTAVTGARQLFMALRPGGHARIAVPDWHMGTCAPTTAWVDRYGGVPPGCDGSELTKDAAFGHEVHYTRELLTAMMEMAGLVTTPVEWHDAAGRLHQRRCDRSPSPFAARAMHGGGRSLTHPRHVVWAWLVLRYSDVDGPVMRSARHDVRGAQSVIVDAVRPALAGLVPSRGLLQSRRKRSASTHRGLLASRISAHCCVVRLCCVAVCLCGLCGFMNRSRNVQRHGAIKRWYCVFRANRQCQCHARVRCSLPRVCSDTVRSPLGTPRPAQLHC